MTQTPILRALASHLEAIIAFLAAIGILAFANFKQMPHGFEDFLLMRITLSHVVLGLLFLAAWKPCFGTLGAEGSVQLPLIGICGRVVRGATLATLVFASILYMARVKTPALPVVPYFFFATIALVGARLLFTHWLNNAPWRLRTQVLILGTGPIARRTWRRIRTEHHNSISVVGFADTNGPQSTYPEITSNYLGDVADLERILLKNVVDTVVIALPVKSCYEAIQRAVAVAEQVGVFVVFNNVFESSKAGKPVLELDGHDAHGDPLGQFLKRCIDVIGASCALLALSPLFLVLLLLVKLSSSGPAFFIQERYGYRRRRFRLYKFRTMVTDAEKMLTQLERRNEAVGPIFKMRNDPRVTPIGRLLRRSSMDELPQLLNVLTGSMSLVGPRPMSVRDVSLFTSSHLMRRFRVKPGITGLWQVSGRSNLPFDQWIVMDFRYIDNWSLGLDLSILLRTLPAVLKGSGAM